MIQMMTVITVLLLGLAVGSFLNVVIYRLPLGILHDYDKERWNIVWPASHCPRCECQLAWWHNIPVISYMLLKGRCAFCKAGISVQYPVVESVTAGLSVLVALICQDLWLMVQSLLLIWLLIPLWVIDWRYQLLPDQLSLSLLWLGLLFSACHILPITPSTAIISAVIGFMSFWLLDAIYYLIRGQHGLGGGDMKLLAAWGAWLGWFYLPMLVLLASVLTLMVFIAQVGWKGWHGQARLAFGPYLIISGGCLWFGSILASLN